MKKVFCFIVFLIVFSTSSPAQIINQKEVNNIMKECQKEANEIVDSMNKSFKKGNNNNSSNELIKEYKKEANALIDSVNENSKRDNTDNNSDDKSENSDRSTDDRDSKEASWTISDCYQAQPGFVGSYWANTFNIAEDKNGYYFIFNMYASDGYYTKKVDITPFVYFKDINGKIIQLRRDDEPYYTYNIDGYWDGDTYMPERYVTRFIYDIDDIDDFISHTFVKYRISLGEGYSDVDMSSGYYKKFNKRLRACVDQVTNEYKEKGDILKDPLKGF